MFKARPPFERYPSNEPQQDGTSNKVSHIIKNDWTDSGNMLLLTGYTSLGYLIQVFGAKKRITEGIVTIILGNEPNIQEQSSIENFQGSLEKELTEYWLSRGISLTNFGPLLRLIKLLEENAWPTFKVLSKLHGKLYLSDRAVTTGSSNFSKTGFELNSEINCRFTNEDDRYRELSQIAEIYNSDATEITRQIIDLLKKLLKHVTWKEALARAVSEILDGDWMKKYLENISRYHQEKLWPTQIRAISQAMIIIEQQGSVLIAEPTGAGKTKIGSYLLRALYDRSNMRGIGHQSNYAMITPPSVIENWKNEISKVGTFADPISQGLVSKANKELQHRIRRSNLLLIDEAHNYLNPVSGRSKFLGQNLADHVLLFTATPINKKGHDLLRMVELLGPDNLNEDTLKTFDNLRRKRNQKNYSEDELDILKNAIAGVMVRHTKKQINEIVDQQPENFLNKEQKRCRFPEQISTFYEIPSTSADTDIAKQINELCKKIKGVLYLCQWRKIRNTAEALGVSPEEYVKIRIKSAPALAVYKIQNCLRSSKFALIEHLSGTTFAKEEAGLKESVKQNETGNIIKKLEDGISFTCNDMDILPLIPDWIRNAEEFNKVVQDELKIFREIQVLATKLSDDRERIKAKHLCDLLKKHNKVLAYDSILLTTAYISKLIKNEKPKDTEVIHITGSKEKKEKKRFQEMFDFGASEKKKVIAVCTDAVSEGINLQQASAVVFLDMPTVIRKAEQRAGRVDRLDSPHKEIEIHWPRDSEEFKLKTDKKFKIRLDIVEKVIGSNLQMPDEEIEIVEVDTNEFVKEYKDVISGEHKSENIISDDAFAEIKGLIGDGSIIPDDIYNSIRTHDARATSFVSFVEQKGQESWAFFALRGTERHAPQWILIKDNNEIITDLSTIAKFLHSKSKELSDIGPDSVLDLHIDGFMKKLKLSGVNLLPNRRRKVVETIQSEVKKLRSENNPEIKKLKISILNQFKDLLKKNVQQDEKMVDWYELSQKLLELLISDYRFGTDRFGKRKSMRIKILTRRMVKDEKVLSKIDQILKNAPLDLSYENRVIAAIFCFNRN